MAFMLNSAELNAQTVEVKERTNKNWKKTKKGAVIGGLVGAGTGALLSKNSRLKGAAIGAGVGAGAGYLYGRSREKKYPTVNRTEYKRTVKYKY